MVYQMVQNSIEIHAGQGSDVVKALAHATQKLDEERYTVQNVIDFSITHRDRRDRLGFEQ